MNTGIHIGGTSATFSPCRRYRYSLWRTWGDMLYAGKGYAMFICLNPSTADETTDDPTVRRCIGYSRAWGYDGFMMSNIFAYRATDPADMLAQDDPIGPDNDQALTDLANGAGIVVAAWGTHGAHLGRGDQVKKMIQGLHYLRLTKDGFPGHPLYLPKSLTPELWT